MLLKIVKSLICMSFITVFFLVSCSDFYVSGGDKPLYDNAVQTAPVIVPGATSSRGNSRAESDLLAAKPVLNYIFETFREYDNDRDEGNIGLGNIYKVLYQAGSFYETHAVSPKQLEASKIIAAPFNFGTTARTYTHAANSTMLKHGYAMSKATDGTVSCILTWYVTNGGTNNEYGVFEGNFNQTTGDLLINMAVLVDYPESNEGGDYCLRTYIEGNEKTHMFKVNTSSYNSAGSQYAIIGYGNSDSTSSDAYFILKVKSSDMDSYPDGRYYKFKAEDTESDLAGYEDIGYDASGITSVLDPEDYKSTVDTISMFATDGSDHPTALSDFTNSTHYLDLD
jgi:hypothetical protein